MVDTIINQTSLCATALRFKLLFSSSLIPCWRYTQINLSTRLDFALNPFFPHFKTGWALHGRLCSREWWECWICICCSYLKVQRCWNTSSKDQLLVQHCGWYIYMTTSNLIWSLPQITREWITILGTNEADLSLGDPLAVVAQVFQGSKPVMNARVRWVV